MNMLYGLLLSRVNGELGESMFYLLLLPQQQTNQASLLQPGFAKLYMFTVLQL